MIDAKKIKESLSNSDIIKFVNFLGADGYIDKGDFIIFPTICHNELGTEANMKLYYYENKHLFVCYTECNESFDIFGLILRVMELNNKELPYGNNFFGALSYLMDFFNLNSGFQFEKKETYTIIRDKFKKKSYEIVLDEYNTNVLDVFRFQPTVEWLSEGISKETMRKFNILYYDYENKIIIPHYDIDNRLIGIRGRNLNDDGPKYMPVMIENKIYKHQLSLALYGLNNTKEVIKEIKTAVIFEGEKSVLKCEDLLSKNYSVASCGSAINKFQINTLLKMGVREIIIAFDKEYEKSNTPESDRYFNKLYNLCAKYKNYCNISFIYDMDDLLDHKDSPIDKGVDIFNQLIQKRITIRK